MDAYASMEKCWGWKSVGDEVCNINSPRPAVVVLPRCAAEKGGTSLPCCSPQAEMAVRPERQSILQYGGVSC